MKVNGEKVNPVGFMMGAAAWIFVHAPQMVVGSVREIGKDIKKEKEKRDAMKGIKLMQKYLNELYDEGIIDANKYENIMVTVVNEYVKEYT